MIEPSWVDVNPKPAVTDTHGEFADQIWEISLIGVTKVISQPLGTLAPDLMPEPNNSAKVEGPA